MEADEGGPIAEFSSVRSPPPSARSTACWGTAVLLVRALLLHLSINDERRARIHESEESQTFQALRPGNRPARP